MSGLLVDGLHGAFVADGFGASPRASARHPQRPLEGVRLAVKDVYDVRGMTAGAGNLEWKADAGVASRTAISVDLLLGAGCRWIGKTVTDELTYSLAGINRHYGTPLNPAAPGRLPGGSSSGSAVAVAAGHADLALGTDCGGSVRLPASYCGIWGMRPSHGRIAVNGCFTLAHSLDTVGWFARDGATLGSAFNCLANESLEAPMPGQLLVSEDVLEQLDGDCRRAFEDWLQRAQVVHRRLPLGSLPLEHWAQALRVLQAAEVWQQLGSWIDRRKPLFGDDIAARLRAAKAIAPAQVAEANRQRINAQARLSALLADGSLLLMPAVPGGAPLLDAPGDQVQETRLRSQRLLCMAGLAGLPQVVTPWTTLETAPVGVSLIGARFSDASLLARARVLHSDFIR